MKAPMMPPVVEITWVDSSSGQGWRLESDAKDWIASQCICFSVGYLVARDRFTLTISTTWRHNRHTCDLFAIPRPCVVRFRVLRRGKIPF